VKLRVINIVTQRTTEDAQRNTEDAQRNTEDKLHQLLFDNSFVAFLRDQPNIVPVFFTIALSRKAGILFGKKFLFQPVLRLHGHRRHVWNRRSGSLTSGRFNLAQQG